MAISAPMEHLVTRLRATGGSGLAAALAYGSRLVSASPDRHSAYDLVVVVEDYRDFYRALYDAGHTARNVTLLATVSRVLAPTVIAFWPAPPDGPLAKCLVLSCTDFERELGPRRLDHFCLGRMAHHVSVVHARDPETAARVGELIAGAREMVLDWTLPFLDGPFSVDDFCRRMLEVSYAGEIRPERGSRVRTVYEGPAGDPALHLHAHSGCQSGLRDARTVEWEVPRGSSPLGDVPAPAERVLRRQQGASHHPLVQAHADVRQLVPLHRAQDRKAHGDDGRDHSPGAAFPVPAAASQGIPVAAGQGSWITREPEVDGCRA